jgi:hypothetical protein
MKNDEITAGDKDTLEAKQSKMRRLFKLVHEDMLLMLMKVRLVLM